MSYTTQKQRNIGKMFLTIIVLAVIVALVIIFTGCSTAPTATPDTNASAAATPEEEPAVEENTNPAFGDVVTFENGVSLSVSQPAEYSPSDTASGPVEGQQSTVFEFVVTNNSKENFDPTLVYATASSGGVEADGIFDVEKSVGFPPSTAVLPGQTVKWLQAFSFVDPAAITLEVSVGFEYDSIIYTNIK